jgi:MFS family permease
MTNSAATANPAKANYNRFLLLVAGLGGLLYGIDIGVIDPALPYLNQSIKLTEQQTSYIVAAVLGGSLLGSVIAGLLADWLGRKKMMIVSAFLFVASVAIIFTSQSFVPLMAGRLLQGLSGGVIAVVVPLYLAESLAARSRGAGTAIFQFLLTFGIVLAAFVGRYFIGNAESGRHSGRGGSCLAWHVFNRDVSGINVPDRQLSYQRVSKMVVPAWPDRRGAGRAPKIPFRRGSGNRDQRNGGLAGA